MKTPLTGKIIILGVTGSIAAYKAADLASKLAQAGALVDVVLTQAALQFITPLTFQSVTGRRAYTDSDLWGPEGHVKHIALGRSADLLVIAPASANTLAKLANGLADNLLSVTALAAGGRQDPACPILVAPAMDGGMFAHPATQANLELLRSRGVIVIGPAEGHLASGLVGLGRMVEPPELLGQIRLALSKDGPLAGRKIVVTASGTQEPIDPVRAITNRSSGKQGFALAQAALDLGAQVTLISGPTALVEPAGARRVDVHTAQEMLEAALAHAQDAEALLMAAAVADFRPASVSAQKIKKEGGAPELRLEATPDILKTLGELKAKSGYPRFMVGFAAESQSLLENARRKLESKHLDLIAANDISAPQAGFGVDTNRVSILSENGSVETLPLMSKAEVAENILARITCLLQGGTIVHLTTRPQWRATEPLSEFRAASLENEGFIHASRPDQILGVANRYYTGLGQAVLLWIDTRKLKAPLRWENSGEETFPHIYGPLNVEAVTEVTDLPAGADGVYREIPHGPHP